MAKKILPGEMSTMRAAEELRSGRVCDAKFAWQTSMAVAHNGFPHKWMATTTELLGQPPTGDSSIDSKRVSGSIGARILVTSIVQNVVVHW